MLGCYSIFYPKAAYHKILRQQFHRHTDIVGIIQMFVVIDVGTKNLDRLKISTCRVAKSCAMFCCKK